MSLHMVYQFHMNNISFNTLFIHYVIILMETLLMICEILTWRELITVLQFQLKSLLIHLQAVSIWFSSIK